MLLPTLLYTTNLKPELAKADLRVADPTAEEAERAIAENTVAPGADKEKNDSDPVLCESV